MHSTSRDAPDEGKGGLDVAEGPNDPRTVMESFTRAINDHDLAPRVSQDR
jgi:hypothetical protein